MTENNVILTLGAPDARLQNCWQRFDGDDCFESHTIEFTDAHGVQRFEFGACVIRCVRKFQWLVNGEKDSVGCGFRIPEIIYYDVERRDDLLQIRVYSDELAIDTLLTVKFEDIDFTNPFRQELDL